MAGIFEREEAGRVWRMPGEKEAALTHTQDTKPVSLSLSRAFRSSFFLRGACAPDSDRYLWEFELSNVCL